LDETPNKECRRVTQIRVHNRVLFDVRRAPGVRAEYGPARRRAAAAASHRYTGDDSAAVAQFEKAPSLPRYERAVLYGHVGRKAQARRELEGVYAEDPGFEDMRIRLGLGA